MTEEGTIMTQCEHKYESESSPVAVADPPEAQIVTTATTRGASDILMNSRNIFERGMNNASCERRDHISPPQR
jgi:hypothetical protein